MSTEKDAPKSGESRELSAEEEEKLYVLKQLSKIFEESEERQTINLEDFEKCLDVFVRLYRNNEAAIRFGPSRSGYWLFAAPLSDILKKEGIDETLFEETTFSVIQMAGNIILNREVDFPIEKPTYDLVEKRELAEKLKKISVKAEWVGEIINEAIENFDDEFERFISLAQGRRVLREQVWKLCSGLFEDRRRAITFIINAIERSRAKDITISQLNLIRDAVLSLAQDDINIDEIEDNMLTIGHE
ncbi:hypothetical protein FJZ31_40765 [Candidatus Poribacteria bacterium]|nr:hypothetical protein [Candidatus Poribacteria bacterium]